MTASSLKPTNGRRKCWHSDRQKPHPHWIWIRFARPATISKVVLGYSDAGGPADFVGQATLDQGRSFQTLFQKTNVRVSAAQPSIAVEFPPVVADNFRLMITRSSEAGHPDRTQLAEVQVLGRWAGSPPAQAMAAPSRQRGNITDGPMPEGLKVQSTPDEVTFVSPWLKISFDLTRPCVRWFSLDGLGGGNHAKNLLKGTAGFDAVANGWNQTASSVGASFAVSRTGSTVRYSGIQLGKLETLDLTYTIQPKGLRINIDRQVPAEYRSMVASSPLRMTWDPTVTPPSPLGRLKTPGELAFPVLLHFPDYGTLLVRTTGADASWKYVGGLDAPELQLALQCGQRITPETAVVQPAGRYRVTLDMDLAPVYPEKELVDADPKLLGVKRGWLGAFGFRPDIASLANNSVGWNAIFCLFEFADQAYYTPPLFDDFTALDLVRMTLDAYFDGQYAFFPQYASFGDSDPAIIISAWDYVTGKPDMAWLRKRLTDIERHADRLIAADLNGDGLPECAMPDGVERDGVYEASFNGISGRSETGNRGGRNNWWDMIGFGWNDAYCSALDYRAFRCAADLERRLGRLAKAETYRKQAKRIKTAYYRTFYDPKTGVLAGWRSKDGQLHDYYFTFVNGIAVAYGLVTREQGNSIMDHMQAKMREVGYTHFRLGLPGNLVPIRRDDYYIGLLGSPSKPDGSDTFGVFENGGATSAYAHFYIQALYALGRKAEADAILDPILESFRNGSYHKPPHGEWTRWDGTPSGCERCLLTDCYYSLSVLITGRLGKGIPIP